MDSRILKLCPNNSYQTKYPVIKTIYVFGDIHGDYNLAIEMLKLSQTIKITNNDIEWIGGDAYIVQIGDQIDSCRPEPNLKCDEINNKMGEDIKVLELFTYLNTLAEKSGGKVISLLGNHEIMNMQGNLSYVSQDNLLLLDKNISVAKNLRKQQFAPGNEYGNMLGCTRQASVIIGTHLFIHAGIIDKLIEYFEQNNIKNLDEINLYIKLWCLNQNPNIDLHTILDNQNLSPFWIRDLGTLQSNLDLSNSKCDIIKKTIQFYQINDIIIGHTPQSFINNLDINSTCSKKIWRVDNGSASAFDNFDHELTNTGKTNFNRRCQILKISDDIKYDILYFENNKIITKSV